MANQRIFGAGDKRTVHPAKFLHYTLTKIVLDAHCRLCIVVTSLPAALSSAILLTPLRTVSAQAIAGYGYPYLSSDHPSYKGFVAGPADASDSDGQKVLADVDNAFGRSIHWLAWKHRVDEIRAGDPNECLGNLSIALTGLGGAYDAKSAGATTLLTLLPTAGALIGTPVTELWVLSKLMPLAGVVSALLSLGDNIVPSDVNDYERVAADFTYSGMVASKPDQHETNAAMVENDEGEGEDDVVADMKEAALFARKVAARAKDTSGTRKSGVIAIGIAVQIFLLGLIMVAYWLLQSGSVVVWWCTFYPWMFFWYGCVAFASLLENFAGVPFTRQWKLRVSRAPKVEISPDAPWSIPEIEMRHRTDIQPSSSKGPSTSSEEVAFHPQQLTPRGSQYSAVSQQLFGRGEILRNLEKGYNTFGRVLIKPDQPWSAANNAFYVIISVRGITTPHAFLRVLSKLVSIGAYTAGTGIFASSTLATIPVAVVVACLVLIAGVFGRVVAMWMASELMKDRPLLHKVAKDRADAQRYIEAMLRKPGMVFEVLGHVITDGRVIKRYRKPLRWSKILGVLADPYDITKLATPGYSKV